ncbi:MAG: C1 family peptidase [Candidatus Auribacterota bacterium]|nr:C1 family peptidase [Candidatus Auribacterota bacterium]
MKLLQFIIISSLFLTVSINAADQSVDIKAIRKAIFENGLDWEAADYGRTFALGLIPNGEPTRASEAPFTYSGINLPAYIDWRYNNGNFVSPIKDQETCGACWAFAAVGALESTIAVSNNTPGTLYDLSEQILISCCTEANGCNGGSTLDAARFLVTDGTSYEDCFPYQSTDISCTQACPGWRDYSFKIQNFQPVVWTLEALKEAICLHGPIQSTMDVYSDFYSYSTGVYENSIGEKIGGHAIILIGYQDKPDGEYGGGYFICKNSWGTWWGEGGYFRIGYSQVSYDMNFGDDSYIYYYSGPQRTPTPEPTPIERYSPGCRSDFNGDGTADITLFRPDSGLWAIRDITRLYFGGLDDRPVPGDYDGDQTTDISLFRPGSGLWAIRRITRYYFGARFDIPTPGDYDGDGTYDPGLFRPSSGLWAIKGISRAYFGHGEDIPIARDYTGDGTTDLAIFRRDTGLWAIRSISRFYFGGEEDIPIPGDYTGDLIADIGLFRPSSGLWAIRDIRRVYFGGSSDQTVPADYNGDGQETIAIFRETSGLWAFENGERLYFGKIGDIPVLE